MEQFINTPAFFWIFWVVITLFGMLLGWVLRAAVHGRNLRDEFDMSEQERLHLAAINAQLREAHDLKEADLKKARLELDELRARAEAADNEKQLQLAAIQSAAARLQTAQTALAEREAQIQVQEEQILGLRARNAALAQENGQIREEINAWKNLHMDFSAMQKNAAALEETIAQMEHERNQIRRELDVAYLEIENLQAEIMASRQFSANGNGHEVAAEIAFSPAPDVDAAPADDLKIINGISPFSEQRLRELGISQFAHLAVWDAATAASMNAALGLFPGRIEKENWVEQARHLLALQQAN